MSVTEAPEHICGWRTPSGQVCRPSECAACCADNQK